MLFLNFDENSLVINLTLFLVGALGVWLAGTRLSGYVDMLADRTRIGTAFAGALLLGGATSLPELATTVTASLSGAAELAGTNLLGGVVMQIAVLAGIDLLLLRGKPLTLFSPNAALLMQGVLLIVLLAVAIAATSVGEVRTVAGIGAWPIAIVAIFLLGLWVSWRYEGNPRWEPKGELDQPPESAKDLKDARHAAFANIATTMIGVRFVGAACGVLLFGVLVARSGESIASQTGLGQGLVGATLVALATSLPEVSTTYSAVRFGAYSMAAANILGTNILEVALFLPAEIAYRDGAIMNQMPASSALLGSLGIVVTAIYLWGILERRDQTIFGMGYDSAAVLVIYASGMALFSTL